MTDAAWSEPLATSFEEAADLIRRLWSRARRVEAAVADPDRLVSLLDGRVARAGPVHVDVFGDRPPWVDFPATWRFTQVAEPPCPEFLLIYTDGSGFPDCAVVLTADAEGWSWISVHRRPLVLQRLRDRLAALNARTQCQPDTAVAGSVRERFIGRPHHDAGSAADVPFDSLTPSELYARVLQAHFAARQSQTRGARPSDAPELAVHQLRAFERASAILDRYGGVIVADAVGLGKTYVGLRLLEGVLKQGGRVLVVVPAALRHQWQHELAYLTGTPRPMTGTDTKRNSRATDTLDFWVRESDTRPLILLSMESLGRRNFEPASLPPADLVLVDEAHNFRNPATRRYRALADLVRHARVVLLTATPINNTIYDLQHLIDLFAAPGAFRHLGIPDYRKSFRQAAEVPDEIRKIISACTLRRTRRFVRTHYGNIRVRDAQTDRPLDLAFPERRPPVAVAYDLAGIYGSLFARLDKWLADLRFPVLDPGSVERNRVAQQAAGDLLKIILLKRLESSLEAFRRSVVQQLAWCSTALRALDSGRVLTRPDYRATFRGPADDPGSQLAFFELMLPAPAVEPDQLREFQRELRKDLETLADMHTALSTVGPAADKKLANLRELLAGPLAGLKVLVFSEFRDTARYIHRELRDLPHIARIDSGGARLGLEPASRREVIERFAPRSNRTRPPPERERVDLLIATDVLSEGLNLQDASVVVSYDLPWNPVRLMQRIGRVDRLGAVVDVVQLYHFTPTRDLDRLLGLMSRLQSKVETIASTLGLDAPVLAAAAAAEPSLDHVRALSRDPHSLDRLEAEIEGPLDPEEQAYLDWSASPEFAAAANPAHFAASAVTDPQRTTVGAVAYWRVGDRDLSRGLWLVADLETGAIVEDQAGALELWRGARELVQREPPIDSLHRARRLCARYVRSILQRIEVSRLAGDALSPNLPQSRIAAWLSRTFRTAAHRLTNDERQRIEDLLDRLTRRYTLATERALSALADALPQEPEPACVDRLADELHALKSVGPAALEPKEVAVLLTLPAE